MLVLDLQTDRLTSPDIQTYWAQNSGLGAHARLRS